MPVELTKNHVRGAVLLHPKDGVSFEEFDKYWIEKHGDLFSSLPIVKKNLIKYEQFHFNADLNKELAKVGLYKSPYYGIANFEAESDEKLLEVFEDPEYKRLLLPDEDKFFDKSMSELIVGKMAVFIDKTRAQA
ncbi:hypothetical protein EUX98_g9478 [Antrodiella citrinella]|uniref:EthD domain-containing protein n=1 Tax=Antrodiella citrinella TaxID=2447956 RepID=A0A4S4LUC1_9APHY|nr:hypothetical protein EUX98_g9478 [Antrodiella citrinella]